jgi:nicotinamidase-related amidase
MAAAIRQMTSVVSLRAFANSTSIPLVVLVDLQQEYLAKPRLLALSEADAALANCRRVLDHARRIGLPVAFIRMVGESAFFNRATPFIRWIEGFEPSRNEMVFERAGPSCYSCEPFAAFMEHSRGGIVMAGFAGESSCLSTLIEAFHRKHRVTYLCDASASHALDEMAADEVHRAVSKISGVYAEVCETAEWIAATTPRKLGNDRRGNGNLGSGNLGNGNLGNGNLGNGMSAGG